MQVSLLEIRRHRPDNRLGQDGKRVLVPPAGGWKKRRHKIVQQKKENIAPYANDGVLHIHARVFDS